MKYWDDKPYHSFNYFLKHKFHNKIAKISIDAGFSCPNRDGTIGTTGCIFCSDRGSGDFTAPSSYSLQAQYQFGKHKISTKWPNAKYLLHFQAFTNTYAPIEELRALYEEAITLPDVIGLAIATRPDCLSDEVISLLQELSTKTYILVEFGLQTIHDKTADIIHRGYPLSVFEDTMKRLAPTNIDVACHLIFGLPGETKEDMLQSVTYLANTNIHGVKFQNLYVLKDTLLATLYERGELPIFEKEEYMDLLMKAITLLSPDQVIHRLTGDGPKSDLIAPMWTWDKRAFLNEFHKRIKQEEIYQGKEWKDQL